MRLEQIGTVAVSLIKGRRAAVVTDENVEKLYLSQCKESLDNAGFEVYSFTVAAGEQSKSGQTYLNLMEFLAEIPLTRSDVLIALGGGVVGDLTGFAAATYLRGIPVIQVPTTLLAAVDSSIGGKTAINLAAGKNLAGAFHQPVFILRDAALLDTLPSEIYKDGMAEVIKYGVLTDRKLFELLCDKEKAARETEWIMERCAEIKLGYVEKDERDTGIRQLLNLGHTIAHAVEKATDYQVSHGSAVAKGMAAISDISAKQGWCSRKTAERIRLLLETYGFDLEIEQSKEVLYEIMKTDKKRKGGVIDIVVPEDIGKCRLQRITIEELYELL